MTQIFGRVVENAWTASYLILAVIFLRVMLKKAPKWISCLLWGLVAFRLVCPFHPESIFSLIPHTKGTTADQEIIVQKLASGIQKLSEGGEALPADQLLTAPAADTTSMQAWGATFGVLWILGMAAMLFYALCSIWIMRKKLSASVRLFDNVYQCDTIPGAFIMGVFKPQIYLPGKLAPSEREFVLAHESAHIRRGDHLWKPFGFLVLTVYWFHPLCWIAYILLCRDIEYACDEVATRNMSKEEKADYCQTLLDCTVHQRVITACPVAFGEVNVKARIKAVLHYKKPVFWVVITALAACVIVGICFATDPQEKKAGMQEASIQAEQHPETGETDAIKRAEQEALEAKEEELDALVKRAEQEALEKKREAAVVLTEEKYQEEMNAQAAEGIHKWATAFSERDGETILALSSAEVQDSLIRREWLTVGEDWASFGFSSPMVIWDGDVIFGVSETTENAAEILYYAWTSEPHVSVWRETISYSLQDGKFVVTGEELHYYDHIAMGAEYDDAYAAGIQGTRMDYTANGMGQSLNEHAVSNSSNLHYRDLLEPTGAARQLLNLLDNPNKVKVEMSEEDASDGVNVQITFAEDDVTRTVSMIQPWGESGIWVPQ
ncbi:MAG: hypothetical protein IJ747_03370 [Lachnospiraceae bacterium]|nr:hypothetical protein [Lachnospiraceae bacterium]